MLKYDGLAGVPSVSLVVRYVAMGTGVSVDAIRSRSHQKVISMARHIAMYLCCLMTGRSTVRIGTLLRRDHSTVRAGRDKVLSAMDWDVGLRVMVSDIQIAIRAALIRGMDHGYQRQEEAAINQIAA